MSRLLTPPTRLRMPARRDVVGLGLGICAALLAGPDARAQDASFVDPLTEAAPQGGAGQDGQGSAIAPPFRIVEITSLQSEVVEIFEFGCPYCRALNDDLRRWGSTLPPGWAFNQMPALVGPTFFNMSLAFLAEQQADLTGLPAFMSHCFSLVQDQKLAIDDLKTYVTAAELTGTDLGRFRQALEDPRNKATLMNFARINQEAQITATPSLIINGRYVITPNDTNGNYGLFFNLADGLISQSITNGPDTPPSPGVPDASSTTAQAQGSP